jgi:copper chaperone CopZ
MTDQSQNMASQNKDCCSTEDCCSDDDQRISATYQVAGMTCGHCERAVIREVSSLIGVSDVRVDLSSGSVTVFSDRPISRRSVEAAIDEAGYTLI